MEIRKCILTNNDCYGRAPITPRGIIVHSTGCNNPTLKRYLAPDDGIIGKNKNNNHWNRHGVNKCVHGFIGKDVNGDVQVYQTLQFEQCSWGVGKGKKGSYNYSPHGYIQFEICEDGLTDRTYFLKAFSLAAKFCAYLCIEYGLEVNRVISHHEAYLEGYASNHGDCDKWLKKFGYNMDWFRESVRLEIIEMQEGLVAKLNAIEETIIEPEYVTVTKGQSLSKIAKANGITLAKIKELNPQITAPLYIVRVGQKVRIK